MTAKRLLIALGAATLLLAACGDDDAQITGQDVIDSAEERADDAQRRMDEITERTGDAVDDAADGSASLEVSESKVEGNTAMLTMEVSGVTIVAPDGDTSGKTGHFHVFVDREPLKEGATIPVEDGIVHSAANPIQVPGLSPGEHKLTVVVGDGTHTRILGDVQAEVTVTVE